MEEMLLVIGIMVSCTLIGVGGLGNRLNKVDKKLDKILKHLGIEEEE